MKDCIIFLLFLNFLLGSVSSLTIPTEILGHVAETHPKDELDTTIQAIKALKRPEPMKITFLTIGSRGDVQPSIALCRGLQNEGHTCTIATHPEFKDLIEAYDIKFANIGGSPTELMEHCVKHGILSASFWLEGYSKFANWYQDLLETSYRVCEASKADLLIESPSAMVGTHIAEALRIPYFRAFTMPWTKTSKYPHAFAPQSWSWIPFFNSRSYDVFEYAVWLGISPHVNRWRRTKGLQRLSYTTLKSRKYPFLYNFSEWVVKRPKDWDSSITLTGYWFLDEKPNPDKKAPVESQIPKGLENFIKNAREEHKKIVYIGFGSVVVPDPEKMTTTINNAVKRSDVYAIISAGWSDRLSKSSSSGSETQNQFSNRIFNVKSVPHDWLFTKIDAAVHHGGAGSTAASIRAGIPTIIKPFFGDQNFWAHRVKTLGVGSHVENLKENQLANAIRDATTNPETIKRAKDLGKKLKDENGVKKAIEKIYEQLDESRSMSLRYSLDANSSTKGGKSDFADGLSRLALLWITYPLILITRTFKYLLN